MKRLSQIESPFFRDYVCSLFPKAILSGFYSPFSIAITSLGEGRANSSAFRTFVRFALLWFCLFPLPLCVWDGLRFVNVALPRLFSYVFIFYYYFIFFILRGDLF